MRPRLSVVVSAVALVVVACGGGGGATHTTTPPATQGTQPTSAVTGSVFQTPVFQGTPTSFSEARDALRARLDAIGVNVGSVPQDVRKQILAQCHDLGQFANQNKVNDLCNAVQRSMETGDSGLLDQVIAQLDQLTKK